MYSNIILYALKSGTKDLKWDHRWDCFKRSDMKLLKFVKDGVTIPTIYYVADTHIDSGVVEVSSKRKGNYKICLRVKRTVEGKVKDKTKTFKFDKAITYKDAIKEVQSKSIKFTEDIYASARVLVNKRITLKENFEWFYDEKKESLATSTYNDYMSYFKTHIKPKIANKRISEITTSDYQVIVNNILSNGKSPRTAKKLKEMLSPIYKYLVNDKNSEVSLNPIANVVIPKFDNTVVIDLSSNQIKALMESIYSYEQEEFRRVFIWLTAGRRLNEVLSLKWEDINFDKNEYTIRSATNKARKDMTYTLRQQLIDALPQEYKSTGYIFSSIKEPEKKMNAGSLKRHWASILKEANIKKLRIHDLRHIIGSTLVNDGVSLEQVAAVLGHSSVNVTKRYSKIRKDVSNHALDTFFKKVNI